jgi:hypothetical protein
VFHVGRAGNLGYLTHFDQAIKFQTAIHLGLSRVPVGFSSVPAETPKAAARVSEPHCVVESI